MVVRIRDGGIKLTKDNFGPQRTLTSNAPMILDATCSFSKNWPKHATIRIDIRPECKPDIVMDAKDLKFPDNYFDEIYCDPPHYVGNKSNLTMVKLHHRLKGRTSPDPFTRYGWWNNNDDWFDFIKNTNIEFHRCLKPNGRLFYKITESNGCTKPLDLIERMLNFKMFKDEVKSTKSGYRSGKTHWITFIPITLQKEGLEK